MAPFRCSVRLSGRFGVRCPRLKKVEVGIGILRQPLVVSSGFGREIHAAIQDIFTAFGQVKRSELHSALQAR